MEHHHRVEMEKHCFRLTEYLQVPKLSFSTLPMEFCIVPKYYSGEESFRLSNKKKIDRERKREKE